MSDDERVLRSFVEDGEELLGLWTVTKADFAKGRLVPMGGGEQTVAVSDERLLWFTSELEEVATSAIDSIEREFVEQQAAPMIVNAGGLLFILGIFASIGAFLANVGDLMVVTLPAMTGLALFLAARVFAAATGREGETRSGYRLRLRTDDDDTVTVWTDDEDTVDAVAAALSEASGVTVVDGDGEDLEDLPAASPADADVGEPAAADDDSVDAGAGDGAASDDVTQADDAGSEPDSDGSDADDGSDTDDAGSDTTDGDDEDGDGEGDEDGDGDDADGDGDDADANDEGETDEETA